ncbi:MAG TPA: hypothetical protein VM659_14225 [Dongiaceae bacterium]|nr:hypothetical protein [Dongiaceae bacterium]
MSRLRAAVVKTSAAVSIFCLFASFVGPLDIALAKTKPQTPQQGNSTNATPSTNSTKKPGSTCDKTKQATADYKACLDAAAKATQNKGKTKKQGN